MKKIFIDGSAGTTGLRIRERLAKRMDLELIVLPEAVRKDVSARKAALNDCDVAFLCLPDAAAIEAVGLVDNPNVVVIDTSTAHRVNPAWTYGFPEIGALREKITTSKRIANPGCHASGFIALIAPLVEKEMLVKNTRLTATSLTGYSGGGKKMIADYESAATPLHQGGRQYALGQTHKHLPEMVALSQLDFAPAFLPIVMPHYAGMEVVVPVFAHDLQGTRDEIKALYRDYYHEGVVKFVDDPSEDGLMSSAKFSGRDDMEISVFGNDERILLVSRFDNLGKGASGAAIQNMNLVLGVDEQEGLNV